MLYHKESEYKTLMYKEKHLGGALTTIGVVDVEPLYDDYWISRDGDVFSFKRKKIIKMKTRLIGGNNKDKRYKAVDLRVYGKVRTEYNHVLTATKFICNRDPKNAHVNHIDGNRLNNHVSNLEWCTPKYNNIDKINRKKYGKIVPLPLEVEEIQVTCKYKGSEKNVR